MIRLDVDVDTLRPVLRQFAHELLAAMGQPDEGEKGAPGRLAYSEAEVAERLGLEKHVLREQRKLGRIAFCRGPGRRILYRPEHVEAYLAACEERAGEG